MWMGMKQQGQGRTVTSVTWIEDSVLCQNDKGEVDGLEMTDGKWSVSPDEEA